MSSRGEKSTGESLMGTKDSVVAKEQALFDQAEFSPMYREMLRFRWVKSQLIRTAKNVLKYPTKEKV